MLNLHDLQAFVAVAETGSFSRAAQRLHLTQPAISRRVQALETTVRTRLFDRVGKQVYLTDAGQLLLPRASRLLQDAEDSRRLLETLDDGVAGVLGLVTSHHVGLHRLPPVLRTFTRQYPDVQLDIRFEDSEAAHQLIRRAESEIAVVTLDPAGPEDLRSEPLWHDPLCVTVAADHPLTRAGIADFVDLAAERPVLPGPGTFTGRIVADAFAAAGISLRPNLATNYLETIAMLTSIGLGWSVLPRTMIRPPLVELNTRVPARARTLGCLTHPQRQLSNAARAFRSVLLEFADEALTAPSDPSG
ncbi:MAG: LysR family transcriptional regulator [Gammaproteobacteria bacterium]